MDFNDSAAVLLVHVCHLVHLKSEYQLKGDRWFALIFQTNGGVSVASQSLTPAVLTQPNITVGYSLMLMLHNGLIAYLRCI